MASLGWPVVPLILLLHLFLNCASFWDRPKLYMSFLTQSSQVFFPAANLIWRNVHSYNVQTQKFCLTRSSADADNRLDAFSGQSRSTNMVPFHMLYIVSYCAIVTLSLRRAVFTIFVFKKFHDLEMGVKGHSRSLRVISFDRLCMVSY